MHAPAPLPRLVAHLDMDAFYASVELLRRPELRGQMVVVGGSRHRAAAFAGDWPRLGDYTGRGVVTTATYEARARGIHSGMGLMKAAALAPQAVLLPADFDEYRRLSRAFKAAVAEMAPDIEDRGIDEIYIELTHLPRVRDAVGHDPLGGARALAQDIKNNVRRATGLSCSIGLAPNKLLAKICSDLDKPASGRCRCAASTASARKRARSSTRWACTPSANSRPARRTGSSPTSGSTTACGCTRPRTGWTTGRWSRTASRSP